MRETSRSALVTGLGTSLLVAACVLFAAASIVALLAPPKEPIELAEDATPPSRQRRRLPATGRG
jgi:hypothetical protein